MAVGQAGTNVQNTAMVKPQPFASRVGRHIHSGSPESSQGGKGPSVVPGASRDRDGDGDHQYDWDNDGA